MRFALVTLAAVSVASSALAQMPLPPAGTFFTAGLTRGFYFQCPVNCVVTGLSVPDITDPIQVVEFIDFGTTAPPAFAGNVVGTQLFYDNNTPAQSIIPVALPLIAGNFYGVLGCGNATVGSATSQNPYSTQTGMFTSDVLGVPTDIFRLLTQTAIGSNGGNQACSAELGGTISRVDVYISSTGGGTIATNAVEGVGCGGNVIGDGAAYELFTAAAPFDLSNTGHTYIWTGVGYLLLDGAGPIVAPVGTATPFTDDQTQSIALPFSLPSVQGLITDVSLCSNGWMSFEPTTSADLSESVVEFLSQFSRLAFLWDDLNPAAGGTVHAEAVGTNEFHITFTDVPEFGGAGANTCQVVLFDTGVIEVRYGNCSAPDILTGLSAGNGATDPGATDYSDLANIGPVIFTTGFGPFFPNLSLSANTRPILGTSWDIEVDIIPGATVAGVHWFGATNPMIADLASLGLPGCGLYADLDYVVGPWVPTGPTYSYSFAIPAAPASLVGFELYTQAAVATIPASNAFGFETTNGIKGTLGDF